MLTPGDAELLASQRFTVEELAHIYQVPPPMIGDLTHGTFTNSETPLRYFARSTLSSWARRLKSTLSRAVLTSAEIDSGHEIDVDLSGLLRGDDASRWANHKIAVEAGILTTDEVREIEGWGPRGDQAPVIV